MIPRATVALVAGILQAQMVVNFDATRPAARPRELAFPTGGRSPSGREVGVNSQYLTLDGKPWIPVMGEFHYSRYPERYWEEEILKMQAGGVRIVATYVFWIHHEEIEGRFDWSGRRDLRRFVELCGKHGMFVWMRIGPWAHGEVRNGGFPDWLLTASVPRRNDSAYLGYVRRFYGQIGGQLKGLLWKDGGPVVGVQIENEYHEYVPGGGEEHIVTLRRMAREAGLDVPFYTVTGWDNAAVPARDFLPVFGGYPDAFWDRRLTDLPTNPNYFFSLVHREEDVGDDLNSKHPTDDARFRSYPFMTAEMGGGMEVAYHRRPVLQADDIAAMLVAKIGSGVNLYGYYMFHGGTNPQGRKTTLEESQASGGYQDLPVASYDFQAPLGESGQMRPSFRTLKTFHLFLADLGSDLAPMTPVFPDVRPASLTDSETPRLAARMNGHRGFIFINNHQRQYPMRRQAGIRVRVATPSGVVELPRQPVEIPTGAYMIWPVHLGLGGVDLVYATAQPLVRLDGENAFFFFVWPGVAAEFAFDAATVAGVDAPGTTVSTSAGRVFVSGIRPGTRAAIVARGKDGRAVTIFVLTRDQARNCWKSKIAGREHVFLTEADAFFDEDRMYLRAAEPGKLNYSIFPNPYGERPSGDRTFTTYPLGAYPTKPIVARWRKVREAGASDPVKMGAQGVAMAPRDFGGAARWRIRVPKDTLSLASEAFLRIEYTGDIARIYARGALLTDDFYKGTDWEIGLRRFADGAAIDELDLQVLPLRKDAPVYIPRRPAFPPQGEIATVTNVTVVPQYEMVAHLSSR